MKRYYGIDWLRTIACIGIVMMHVAANHAYKISGFVYQKFIPAFTDFVFLFMMISAFGMCCGYFEKVMNGKINWKEFYRKRYCKILPFFLLLIIIDLVMNFSLSALCEGLVEMTLLHGFVPNTFEVIGVGWFLGVVFLFYLIFPFYCVLIENKKTAWCAFLLSLIVNGICSCCFSLGRTNFLYCFCYFIAGGLIYLYKERLETMKWWISIPMVLLSMVLYFSVGENTIGRMAVCAALLILGISANTREVKIISLFSGLSLEIYLSHMVLLRVIEKCGLHTIFGKGWMQYLFTVVLVLTGTIVVSALFQMLSWKKRN